MKIDAPPAQPQDVQAKADVKEVVDRFDRIWKRYKEVDGIRVTMHATGRRGSRP